MSDRVQVGIIGASGYGGVQLVRLILEHPHLELTYLGGSSSAGQTFGEIYPHLGHRPELHDLKIEDLAPEQVADRAQVIFLSLPSGVAPEIAPSLLAAGVKVLDLSADYRFSDLAIYQKWYGHPRADQAIASQAVYGLPEIYGHEIAQAQLVGCAGCYPTASLLALAPLLKQGLIEPNNIVIDAKSGTSGGGRVAKTNLLLAEASNSFGAYGVASHRHTPEIEQVCSDLAAQEILVQFTPHLIPMVRGILATVYGNLRDPGLTTEDLLTIYRSFYRSSRWVKVLPKGTYPQTKWAAGTNLCYLNLEVDRRTGRVVVLSAIDNLMKGQAAQAIQCLNLIMGWEETLGLPQLGFYP
ncbi:MAG: N-acetyl-gamma-glutamyl-phosphate reductase [Pseudanabaenaceae cyanobacterium bins.68]|nr:N-acetyl-gamma-glutamyl-phosphate reductase [Pseudanabaenaceae cyanobacterium bins.68]